MIKIIRPGYRHECTCYYCGCYFSYEDEDTYTKSDSFSLSGYAKKIKCPQCKKENTLEATR